MSEQIPYSSLEKGSLLIASPDITDPFYSRSVILICEHSPAGSFGLMINKPLDIPLPDDLVHQEEIKNPHLYIRAAGPIQPQQVMLLHSCKEIAEHTLEVCPNVYLGGDLNFLHQTLSNPEGPGVMICFGYCGWTSGQLEKEFMNHLWFPHPGKGEYLFDIVPHTLWQHILREKGGKYAMLSMIPEDLTLN